MSQVVRLKRTATQGNAPTTTQLELGELAINTYDGKLFIKKDDGTEAIVVVNPISTKVDFTATSGQDTFTTPYNTSSIDVIVSGIKLRSTEYTATNGTDIILNQPLTTDTWVSVISDGEDPCPEGNGIDNITRTSGDGSSGTTDIYTITYTDNTTDTFSVYNGADGTPTTLSTGTRTGTTYGINSDGSSDDIILLEADSTNAGLLTGTKFDEIGTNTSKVSYPGDATAAELNILDGATLTTAELNILDGATLTTTELNYVDATSSIQTQFDSKAPLASPSLTGVPTSPTATTGTNTTQIASTEYVQNELAALSSYVPQLISVKGDTTDSTTYPTTSTTMTTWVQDITNTNYTFDAGAGTITINSGIDGKLVRVDYQIGGDGATGRVTLEGNLMLNGSIVNVASDYVARDSTSTSGGISAHWVGTVATNDILKINARTINTDLDHDGIQCRFTITTMN